MANPWEKYQQAAPAASPSGGAAPWARYQQAAPQEEAPPERSMGEQFMRGAGITAGGVNRGLLQLVQAPGALLNQAPRLANILPGVEGVGPIVEDYNPAVELGERAGVINQIEPESGLEQALDVGGEALGITAGGLGGLGVLLRGGQAATTGGRIGQEVLQTAQRNPALFAAGELAGGAGSELGQQAAGSIAEDSGMGETGQQVAEGIGALFGGLGGGVLPQAAGASAGAATRGIQRHLLPFTEGGARSRASGQMQRRVVDADDPQRDDVLEAAAQAAEASPEGVTPARATGEEGLMAQEARVLEDNPSLRRGVEGDLEGAQAGAEDELRGLFGEPVTREQWTQNVMERVAAPGARVESGDTDNMLSDAFDSYREAYAPFREEPVNPEGIGQAIDDAIQNPDLFVGDQARGEARRWIEGQLSTLSRRAGEDGSVTSGDLLELRQNIRARQRDLGRSQTERAQEARQVLDGVEDQVTNVLETNLPEGMAGDLRALDNRYREFKIVEDAVFRGGEGGLDPRRVSEAIRRGSSSRGQFARGDQEDLRQTALQGMTGEQLLQDPERAARAMRGLSDEAKRPVQAEVTQSLMRRAQSADAEGRPVLSGRDFKRNVVENRDALQRAGFSEEDIGRMDEIADRLVTIQRQSPTAVSRLLEDRPAAVLDLAAAIVGARHGQDIAGGGMGASLVLAQYFSKAARNLVGRMTSNTAEKLLTDATTDPQLYAALLRGPDSTTKQRRDSARLLQGWLLENAAEQTEDLGDTGEQEETP